MSTTADIAAGARSILEAATEAFARAGFDSVSIADIASHAKVCKANVFHHFKSKEALYEEVIREACKGHAEFTEALLARDDLSSIDKLHELVRFDFVDAFRNELRTHLVIREICNTGCNTGRNLIEPVFLRNFSAVIGLIRQGQERGEFRAGIDPATTAMMIGGSLMLFFQNRETLDSFPGLGRGAQPEDYADKVCRLLLAGLTVAGPDQPSSPRVSA